MGRWIGLAALVAVVAMLWAVVAVLPPVAASLFIGVIIGAGGVLGGVVMGVASAPGRERQIVIVERPPDEADRLFLE